MNKNIFGLGECVTQRTCQGVVLQLSCTKSLRKNLWMLSMVMPSRAFHTAYPMPQFDQFGVKKSQSVSQSKPSSRACQEKRTHVVMHNLESEIQLPETALHPDPAWTSSEMYQERI